MTLLLFVKQLWVLFEASQVHSIGTFHLFLLGFIVFILFYCFACSEASQAHIIGTCHLFFYCLTCFYFFIVSLVLRRHKLIVLVSFNCFFIVSLVFSLFHLYFYSFTCFYCFPHSLSHIKIIYSVV